MKENLRLQLVVLLLQVAFVIGAFATHGAISITCWVIVAVLFVAKWFVMLRGMKKGANAPRSVQAPPNREE